MTEMLGKWPMGEYTTQNGLAGLTRVSPSQEAWSGTASNFVMSLRITHD